MTPAQIIDEVITYGAPEIELLVELLIPSLAGFPIAALLKLADATVRAVEANKASALKAGVAAADAAADAAEEAALKG